MDIGYSGRQITITDKYITLLDRFVFDFVRILDRMTSYVIVSGYVSILFGRSRGTEDIDILVPFMEKEAFGTLHRALLMQGYEFLNAENEEGLYAMLGGRMGLRIAEKDRFIPNIELKFLKDDIDRLVMKDRLEVRIGQESVYISPIEIQIAYKLFLGSEKDLEDAVYLWEIFKDHLDHVAMKSFMKRFAVQGDNYGITV